MIAALALVLQGAAAVRPAAPAAPAAPRDSAHGTVATDTLWSQSLGTRKAVVVYLPPAYARQPALRFAARIAR